MTQFVSNAGVRIAYEVYGEGVPILLVHGFGSSRRQNWKDTGWFDPLARAGFRAVAMDCRGHGDSDRPHDAAAYDHALMVDDILAVQSDAIGAPSFIVGYSMGGFLGMHLLMRAPDRATRLVVGGVGETYLRPNGQGMADAGFRARIADALLADDPATITDPNGKLFRDFADQGGKDRLALAACMRGARSGFDAAELSRAFQPVLVVCGEHDAISGPPGPLAAAFPNGSAVTLARRDHMTSVGERRFKDAAIEFFKAPA